MNSPRLVLCELQDAQPFGMESFSPFCVKAHRALQLCRLPYERRHASRPDVHRQLNPAAQVPVLLVDEEAVCDSTRIVDRLDAISEGALTRGLNDAQKAEAFLWEEMADSVLNGFLVAARWADEANWGAVKDAYFSDMPRPVRAIVPSRIRSKVCKGLWARDVIRPSQETCWQRFEQTLDRLDERAPTSQFWMNGEPCRADIAIFAQLWGFLTPLTPGQASRVRARPRLSSWLLRVQAACVGSS